MIRPEQWQRFVAVVAVGLLMTCVGQRAYADAHPAGRLVVVSQAPGSAHVMFTAVGLPVGATVDLRSVRVDLDGTATTATAARAGSAASSAVARRAVLVFDTSGSMAGAGMAGARSAALAFGASAPADVRVGLVAFAARPHVVLAPTFDRRRLTTAVARLKAGGETSLYDGVSLGLHVLGATGERSMVVLSDGSDTRSHESLSSVTSQLRRAGVRMDAVALHTADTVAAALKHMVAVTGGVVTPSANAAGLASAFSAAARTFASDVILNVVVPDTDRGRVIDVKVSISSSVGELRATTTLRAAGTRTPAAIASAQPRPARGHGLPTSLLALVFAGLFVPLLALLIALENRRSPQARTKRLLDRYTLSHSTTGGQEGSTPPTGLSRASARLMAVTDRVAAKPARREKLLLQLARADVALTPGEWIAVQSLIAFASGVLATLAFGSLLVGLVLALVGFGASSAWLSVKGRRRRRAFEEHLPSALQLVASSLRSGFSLSQSLDGVVREGVEPIAGELNRALGQARLGMELEDALDGIGDRMGSTDFSWVVMAIRIQREVGGNLAEVLMTTTSVMRERARLRRQVRALSAEGRLSAYILLALPLLMAVYMFALRRAYIRPLYTTGLGIGLLVLAVVLVVTGALFMRKIVRVEV